MLGIQYMRICLYEWNQISVNDWDIIELFEISHDQQ